MSVVVVDILVLPLTFFFLPRGSEIWILAKHGRNFINGPPNCTSTLVLMKYIV